MFRDAQSDALCIASECNPFSFENASVFGAIKNIAIILQYLNATVF